MMPPKMTDLLKVWFNLLVLGLKHVWRYPIRSLLTLAGVATGIFLFTTIETMHAAMVSVTRGAAYDTTLVVYRENRFCPFTSRLPEHYADEMLQLPGVAQVVPMQIVVNNCNTSLDVVTFRGIPTDQFDDFATDRFDVLAGSLTDWHQRSDAAVIGAVLAKRRNLSVGDTLDAARVTVHVAAIIASDNPQDENVAYVDLPFLQQASRRGLGEVTQFNVTVEPGADLEQVAATIDDHFRTDQAPTHTRPEKAFIAQTAEDMVSLIGMTRWVGLGAVLAVVALVSNTIVLAVRGRRTAFAVLQTIGYRGWHIMVSVLAEGLVLGAIGGCIGIAASWLVLTSGGWSLSAEGLSIVFTPTGQVLGAAFVVACVLGLGAALFPAWTAARMVIVSSLRLGDA